jgi:chromosome segregation ATPase
LGGAFYGKCRISPWPLGTRLPSPHTRRCVPIRKNRYDGNGIFGYGRRRIHQLRQERDAVVQEAEKQLRAAEGRILRLRQALAAAKTELRDRDAQIKDLTTQIEALAKDPDHMTQNLLAQEMSSILSAAQGTASRIIERAKAVSERNLEKAGELERKLQEDLARLDEWRHQALPVIRAAQSRMGDILATLEGATRTVAETIQPLEQLLDIDRPGTTVADPSSREPVEAEVTTLEPAEEGEGRRPRKRSHRKVAATKDEPQPTEVIEIPDHAGTGL